EAGNHDSNRTDGGATRDSEDIRLREGIAEQRLERAPAQPEGAAHKRCQHCSRQAELEEDGLGGGIGVRGQGADEIPRAEGGGRERSAQRHGRQGGERQQAEASQRRRHGAASSAEASPDPSAVIEDSRMSSPWRKRAIRRAASVTRAPGRLNRSPSTTM